jgi:hypothetical protein
MVRDGESAYEPQDWVDSEQSAAKLVSDDDDNDDDSDDDGK